MIYLLNARFMQAQNKGIWEFGLASTYGRAVTTANFREFDGMILFNSDFPFTTAQGAYFSIEAKSTIRVISMVKVGGVFGYFSSNGIFTRTTPTRISPNGISIPVNIIDSLSTSTRSFFIMPFLEFQPIQQIAVSVGLTLQPISSTFFSQTQNILDSTGGRLTTEINQTGSIPNPNAVLSGWVQLSARLPLNHSQSLFLEPQVRANLALSQQFAALNWKSNSFSAGLGIVFQPQPPRPIMRDTIILRDTITSQDKTITAIQIDLEQTQFLKQDAVETPVEIRQTITQKQIYRRRIPKPTGLLSVNCPVTFVLKDGSESSSVKLTVDEIITNHYSTLLPSVFFSENSSEIPFRYNRKSQIPQQNYSTLDIYYSILPIIGERLLLNPQTHLKIIGCNDRIGETIELSKTRAASVQKYFIEKFGIATSRLEIMSRNLPENASQSGGTLAAEENRRVDFESDNDIILEPVILHDTLRIADPPIIRFRPNVLAESTIQSWKLELLQNKILIRDFMGSDDIPNPLDWEINAEKGIKKLTENPIEYRLTVRDQDNQSQEISGIIRFTEKKRQHENIQAEHLNDHFSLMCFDYDEVKLTKTNSSQLSLIRNLISSDATITIIGSTDAVGKEDYNLELSMRRAKAIAKALKTPKAKIIGAGKDEKTFPNNLPEGRIYSRRVDIIIEKR
jgi:outer membrane protein OmpA-like peptidoglycan-associated protein